MSLRTVLIVGFAIGCAGVTGIYAHNWMKSQRAAAVAQAPAEPEPAIALVDVLVAKEDLSVGAFVRPDLVEWEPWPQNAVKEGYAVSGKTTPEDLAGAVVRTRIQAGEPITSSRVMHPGEQGFLAAVLRHGMRAVSVPVDAASGIAGFVFPGDRVDVILSYRINVQNESPTGGRTRHFSQTLLRGVRVLAVDQTVDNADGKAMLAKTVTLEVDQKQVEILALGMDLGTLSLSLRSLVSDVSGDTTTDSNQISENDTAMSFTRDLDIMYMMSNRNLDEQPVNKPRPVDVLHGVKAEQVVF